MLFANRKAAGKLLAKQLAEYRDAKAVVVALPRGGVVTGYEVAEALHLPLDIVAVRKIGHPASPEFAIGAVDDGGTTLMRTAHRSDIDAVWLRAETERQMKEAQRRAAVYREGIKSRSLEGAIAILVDDGIATGLTRELAVKTVQKHHPIKVVVAVPVAPPDAIANVERLGAKVVILEPPEDYLGAVGAHYVDFPQVTDEEVITLMHSPFRFLT